MAIPMRGTASLVLGMTDETMFMNTVRERRIVTPETRSSTVSQLKFGWKSASKIRIIQTIQRSHESGLG